MRGFVVRGEISFLLGILTLAGCATRSVSTDYRFDPAKLEGLAIVSITAEGLMYGDGASCRYRRLGDGREGFVGATAPRDTATHDKTSSNLSAVALAPGRYEFYRCTVSTRYLGPPDDYVGPVGGTIADDIFAINNATQYPATATSSYTAFGSEHFSARFDIQNGRAVYVGNLRVTWRALDRKVLVEPRNLAAEDLPAAAKRWPQIGATNADVALPRPD
jgi:hypothetical protein